jgi:hypothetical protein
MPTRYIDIDSSSRDRNTKTIFNDGSTTGPSNFIIKEDTSSSNNSTINNSRDPISDQVEVIKWRRSNFMLSISAAASNGIRLKPFIKLLPDSVNYPVSTPTELILTSVLDVTSSVGIGGLQQSVNYYWGAVLNVDNPPASARIVEYEYLGSNKCLVKVDQPIVLTSTSILQIVDPTTNHEDTATIKDYAYIFVPGGPPYESLDGGVVFAEVTGGAHSYFRITEHDVSRNMVKIIPLQSSTVTANSILEISQLSIRMSIPSSGFNNAMDYLNASTMNGYRSSYNVFNLPATTNMINISDRNFVEISSDTEYGVAVVSGSSNKQVTIVGASRTESSEDNAYNGCTLRLILNNTLAPDLYTTEDRLISDYIGSTNLITVNESFSNDISTYDVIKYMIFFPTEARRITSTIDLNTQIFNSYGTLSGNMLNLLEYTSAPGILSSNKNYTTYSNQLRLGDYFNPTNNRTLVGTYIGVDTGGGVYEYGYVLNHYVNHFSDNGSVVRQNYIEVNPAFYTTCTGLAAWPNISASYIKSTRLESVFPRNPQARISDTSAERFAIMLQTADNHSYLNNSGSGVTQSGTKNLDEYKISLINLTLPNKLLKCSKGGYITEYPYVYVTFVNVANKKTAAFLSNNKNTIALNINFKVLINNTVDDQTTKFVVLSSGDMRQTQTLVLDEDIKFAVYMPDGSLFETIESDTESPWRPNKDLQISALFSIENMCVSKK